MQTEYEAMEFNMQTLPPPYDSRRVRHEKELLFLNPVRGNVSKPPKSSVRNNKGIGRFYRCTGVQNYAQRFHPKLYSVHNFAIRAMASEPFRTVPGNLPMPIVCSCT